MLLLNYKKHFAKQRKGKKNGSYGKHWYYHPDTLNNIKCLPEDAPDGYIKGRKIKPDNKCIICNRGIGKKRGKFCIKHKDRGRSPRAYDKRTWKKVEDSYRKLYSVYQLHTFKIFCEITGYEKSQSTLCCMFKKYLPEYETIYNK